MARRPAHRPAAANRPGPLGRFRLPGGGRHPDRAVIHRPARLRTAAGRPRPTRRSRSAHPERRRGSRLVASLPAAAGPRLRAGVANRHRPERRARPAHPRRTCSGHRPRSRTSLRLPEPRRRPLPGPVVGLRCSCCSGLGRGVRSEPVPRLERRARLWCRTASGLTVAPWAAARARGGAERPVTGGFARGRRSGHLGRPQRGARLRFRFVPSGPDEPASRAGHLRRSRLPRGDGRFRGVGRPAPVSATGRTGRFRRPELAWRIQHTFLRHAGGARRRSWPRLGRRTADPRRARHARWVKDAD